MKAKNFIQVSLLKQSLNDTSVPNGFGFYTQKPKKNKDFQYLELTSHKVILIANKNYEKLDDPNRMNINHAPEEISTFRKFAT